MDEGGVEVKWKWEENCGVLVACKIERLHAEDEPPPSVFLRNMNMGV